LLADIARIARSAGSHQSAEQETTAGTDRSTASPTESPTRRRPNTCAEECGSQATEYRGAIGRLSPNLRMGVLFAVGIVFTKQIECFACARQCHYAGAAGNACARGQEKRRKQYQQ
jgi:hypothetical protein